MTQGKQLPSLNALIFEVCRGATFKTGRTVVAGILRHTAPISVIASIGRPVHCYDTRETRVDSKIFTGIPTFSLPRAPRNAYFYLDNEEPIENVGCLFLFESVPMGCVKFMQSGIIAGTEPLLREALKGRKYIPRAHCANFAALEIQTHDTSN
jgi:hypothetical protein